MTLAYSYYAVPTTDPIPIPENDNSMYHNPNITIALSPFAYISTHVTDICHFVILFGDSHVFDSYELLIIIALSSLHYS